MPDFPINYGAGQSILHGPVTVSASGSTNTKGAWTQIVAATTYEYDSIIISYCPNVAGQSHLVDLGIGAAAAEQTLVPNIFAQGNIEAVMHIQIPVNIPAGSRISVRNQCTSASGQVIVNVIGVCSGLWGTPPGGQILDLASVTASSRGVSVDAGAVASTYGAWTQLIASTTLDIAAVMLQIGGIVNVNPSAAVFHAQIGVGAAASEQLLHELFFATNITAWFTCHPYWLPASIPAGSRIAARIKSSTTDATDRVASLNLFGLVL